MDVMIKPVLGNNILKYGLKIWWSDLRYVNGLSYIFQTLVAQTNYFALKCIIFALFILESLTHARLYECEKKLPSYVPTEILCSYNS